MSKIFNSSTCITILQNLKNFTLDLGQFFDLSPFQQYEEADDENHSSENENENNNPIKVVFEELM